MHEFGSGPIFDVGVYIGRFNPIHKGHQRTIEQMMFNHTINHSLLMIGSPNVNLSLRNLFTYKERRDFIKAIYPNIRIAPLPDQISDEDWFSSLIDIIEISFPFYHNVNIYCGDIKDLEHFNYHNKATVKIIDRYEEQVYSATEVRRCIMMGEIEPLTKLIHLDLLYPVYELGRKRLEEMLRGEK